MIHHCADSHTNSIIRFKLSLTEDCPTIRPYFEDRWAELIDSQDNDLSNSVALITAIHTKWVQILKTPYIRRFKAEFLFIPSMANNLPLKKTLVFTHGIAGII